MFKSLSLKVLLFGFIFTFFSSFGQSFFLGLFNSSIRDALSITHGQFGSIYASATLLSSLILVWIGKKIDDVIKYIRREILNKNQVFWVCPLINESKKIDHEAQVDLKETLGHTKIEVMVGSSLP